MFMAICKGGNRKNMYKYKETDKFCKMVYM